MTYTGQLGTGVINEELFQENFNQFYMINIQILIVNFKNQFYKNQLK